MKVRDIMTSPVVSVPQDSTVLEAVRIMLQRHISGLPVVDFFVWVRSFGPTPGSGRNVYRQ